MKLEKSNVQEIFELSLAQKGMLFHYLEDSRSDLYNMQVVLQIDGNLDIGTMKAAFQVVQSNNEALRSVFQWEKVSRPLQIVLREAPIDFVFHDARGKDADKAAAFIDGLIAKDRKERFDLRQVPFRVRLIATANNVFLLLLTHYHILYDGWSTGILLKEVFSCYSRLTDRQSLRPIAKPTYKEIYIALANQANKEASERYWKEYLQGYEARPLVGDKQPLAPEHGQLKEIRIEMEIDGLEQFAVSNGCTKAAVIYTAYGLLLQQYSDRPDIVYGTPASSRPSRISGIEYVMGPFINTIPLRMQDPGHSSLRTLVRELNQQLLTRNQHAGTSYSEIKGWMNIRPKEDLFDSILAIENYPIDPDLRMGEFTLQLKSTYGNTGIPIAGMVFFGSSVEILFAYQTSSISETYIRQFAELFTRILDRIINHPDDTCHSAGYLSMEERRDLLIGFNQTTKTYERSFCILDRIRDQVARQPDRIAIQGGGSSMTYRQLEERSNELAHCFLSQYGIKKGDLVGLLLDRTEMLIITILAILKAGAAFVPVDPAFPASRKNEILADAGITLLVLQMDYLSDIDLTGIPCFAPDIEFTPGQYPSHTPVLPVYGEDLVYVIYTSGSTGRPKGVMIGQEALANYTCWAAEKYSRGDQSNFPLYTSISFDLTITSIFTPLISGNKILIYKDEDAAILLQKAFTDGDSDVLKLTPSHLKILREAAYPLPPYMAGTKLLIVGGEQLDAALARDICRTYPGRLVIYNEYGPTEATVGCMIHRFDPAEDHGSVPIGKPIANMQIYLLSRYGNPVPPGVTGEIYISGRGLSKGYLNNLPLTAERFVANPFHSDPDARMYKTGDLGRWLPDAVLEYIGRIDNQVKIKGYRIEPGEIASRIREYPSVTDAVVTLKDKQHPEKGLIAYYVTTAGKEAPIPALRNFLKDKLPEFMVPAFWVPLNKIPLTINGKLNEKALPDPEKTKNSSGEYIAPRSQTERQLALIWQELLELDQVGALDDFFTLGGDSLSVTRLANRIRNQLSVEVSLTDLFGYTTLEELARHIDSLDKPVLSQLKETTHRSGKIPLSFGQLRLWFIDQMEGTIAYHMPLLLAIDGDIREDVFYKAVRMLVNRHEALRTIVAEWQGEPYQVIQPEDRWEPQPPLPLSDSSPASLNALIAADISQPFDLSRDHLLRVTLLKEGPTVKYILFVAHHIAFDGGSAPIFFEELSRIYSSLIATVPSISASALIATEPPSFPVSSLTATSSVPANPPIATMHSIPVGSLPFQYADYSSWQRSQLTEEALEEGLNYWAAKLKDIRPLQLPADKRRPSPMSRQGADHRFFIEGRIHQELARISQDAGATLFMALLTAFKILLYRITGQSDVCVGAPVANRNRPEWEGLIGFFANTVALRSPLSGDRSFWETLAQVKATTLEAYSYQYVPFEKVIDRVVKDRDLNRTPLFQVFFILNDRKTTYDLRLGETKAIPIEQDQRTAKFELSLEITPAEGGIEMLFNYNTDLFLPGTIALMGIHYRELLADIIQDPHRAVLDLNMLSNDERHRMLKEFNDTKVDFPPHITVLDLFRRQVQKDPAAVALVFEEAELTFGELDEQSDRLANWLAAQYGGLPETLIPVCMQRSFEMVIAILGILKAGAAYVPIDPDYPAERIRFMLADTGARLLLTHSGYKEKILGTGHSSTLGLVELDRRAYLSAPDGTPDYHPLPDQLAYVIYTSGTTGKPKGAMNRHAGLVNRLQWMQDYLGTTSDDVILQKTTFCFDVSVWELLLPLITGCRMVLARPGGHKDTHYLGELIARHKITLIHFVPSMLAAFLPDADTGLCASLRQVICSGEELKPATVKEFRSRFSRTRLYNLYGPTEAAIDVTAIDTGEVADDAPLIPIGRPIANTRLYIVDPVNRLQPQGIAGELLIGGIQVGRGYLNSPALTAGKFIANPIEENDVYQLYRTGDLARWLPDGQIAFLGRIDRQVKIRGYRVEPAEIESALEQCDGIRQAVVLAREDRNDLIAYVVPINKLDRASIDEQIRKQLPEHMIPSLIMEIPELPLNANGKLDKTQLPDPEPAAFLIPEYAAPENETERTLAGIWKPLLEVDQVGRYDSFFALGGHSLLVTKALSAINKEFSIAVSIPTFFQLNTLEKLGKYIDLIATTRKKDSRVPISAIEL